MYFDNFSLLGIMAALAIGGLIVRLMMPQRNDDDRKSMGRDRMADERNRLVRS